MNFDNILNRMVRDVRYVFQFKLDNREELLVDAPSEEPNFREYLSAIFDQAALRAASRLRYQPRVVDNEAVAVEGVTHRFNWNLP